MKTIAVKFAVLLLAFSCVEHDIHPVPENFIKAEVGEETFQYVDLVPDQHVLASNFNFAEFQFKEQKGECRTWTMMIMNLDLKNATYPLTLSTVPMDQNGSAPEFNTSIIDNCTGFYGTVLAQLTNFQSESKLTITSFEDGIITGEFSGISGGNRPMRGAFKVRLVEKVL
jgi:hypothetical protein